jgi:uncharacterized membrane protein YjgN (DUF898 family)
MDSIENHAVPPVAHVAPVTPEGQLPSAAITPAPADGQASRVTRITLRERLTRLLRRREKKSPEIRLTRLPREAAAGERAYAFQFTGQAGEYFRIWIVNTFLVLITLGLWSPWAKIRKRQFMLRHTWVAGANFEFHARPWPILRGRLIAGALFIVYWFTGNLNPKYAAWVALGVALLAPWFVVNSLRFNMANTSYRNLRFAFDARLQDAVLVLWPLALVAVLTVFFPLTFNAKDWQASLPGLIPPTVLALCYPYLTAAFRLMLINRSRLGNASMSSAAHVHTVYGIFFRSFVTGVVSLMALVLWVVIAGKVLEAIIGREEIRRTQWALLGFTVTVALPAGAVFAALSSYVQSRVTNAILNLTTVSTSVRVFSHLKTRALFKNQLLNAIAIVLTCGLAIPWAAVRTAKLRIESASLGAYSDLDDFVADTAARGTASADAASEFFSLDISIRRTSPRVLLAST